MCKGDIIILSDQDDVWLTYKIEKLKDKFINNNDIAFVFSDAIIVDEKLFPLGYTMWKSISFTIYQRRLFRSGYQAEVLLKHNVVTGATLAFRAENRNWILPISDNWVHDEWIALLASAGGARGIFIDESFIKYRIHSKQLVGVGVAVINVIIFGQAAYLRAHKKELFLWNSVIGAILTAISTYFLGCTFGVLGMTVRYFAITAFLGLGWATWIFVTKRGEWHSG